MIQSFLDLCDTIGFPVALEKTEWGATIVIFLGLLIDTVNQVVCIPIEKVEKARVLINHSVVEKENYGKANPEDHWLFELLVQMCNTWESFY